MSMQVVRTYGPDDALRVVRVRSSQSPGVSLTVTPGEWREFVARIKDGAYDADAFDRDSSFGS